MLPSSATPAPPPSSPGEQVVGPDHDVALSERARVDASLVARLACRPRRPRRDRRRRVPARLGDRSTEAHGWSQRALTPYALTAGRAPGTAPARSSPATRRGSARGSRSPRPSRRAPSRSSASRGRARPCRSARRDLPHRRRGRARLAGHPGTVDAIGILAGPGFDAARVRAAAGGAVVLTGDGARQARSRPSSRRAAHG